MRGLGQFWWVAVAVLNVSHAEVANAIMAGGETALPADFPSNRLDPLGASSPFNAVGALAVSSGGWNYKGSGTAISPNWVLTAGHNLDTNDDGAPDAGLVVNFHLPGLGIYTASAFHTHPGFSGFANPSVQRDLGLLYFETPLPVGLSFPSLGYHLQIGDQAALVGFGRSGYGSYGYTTDASLTNRRIGYNVVDTFTPDDQGGGFHAVFRYDFDSPDTFGLPDGSRGNDVESLIGPGDSGGPLLVGLGSGFALAGVNTFIEGYGGRFGDVGGGVVLGPYGDWISAITGIPIPEPTAAALLLLAVTTLVLRARQGQMRLASERRLATSSRRCGSEVHPRPAPASTLPAGLSYLPTCSPATFTLPGRVG